MLSTPLKVMSVLVNGRYCGTTKAPCAAWDCDVTEAIKPGEVNEVCVSIKDVYYALAKGFLTGKYRPGSDAADSPRAEGARAYLDAGGGAVLEVLDELAAAHETTVAAVALSWLLAQPSVVAPIASARNTDQLEQILPAATLRLMTDEVDRLSAVAARSL